jgi:predicted PurR-regulated permease PerM
MNGDPSPVSLRPMSFLAGIAVIAILYFGKEFFLPLIMAILISFLLAPVIHRLEAWHLGRIGSVLVATILTFGLIGGIAYVVAGQLIDLANQLPNYKDTIAAKVATLRPRKDNALDKATQTLKDITKEVIKETPEGVVASAETATVVEQGREPTASPPPAPPVPVQVVKRADSAIEFLRGYAAPLLKPLGNAAVVIVFVIFMLIGREDLRDRIIHLVGRGRLHVTTQALDDAGGRVSRYLLAQLIVNVTYGIPIGIGLYFIGIPNAILWGLFATILRFVPYIGPWLAASFPLFLSLAVGTTWTAPIETLALFVVIELISNNVVEPWLYGASTGLSPMAVIVSAVFWTWIWGGIGLILATPLTVCLAVLGKHLPSFAWLDVLLGDKPPIATGDRLYQRLLANDEEEAVTIVEEYVAANSLAAAYDVVVLHALRQAESDCRADILDETRRRQIYGMLRRILTELDPTPPPPDNVPVAVLAMPASSEADEIAGVMLAHLLEMRGVMARVASSKSLTSEMADQALSSGAHVFCISALPPASVMPATYLARRLRERMPDARIIIGLWETLESETARRLQRFKRAHADDVFTSLERTTAELVALAGLKPETATETPASAAA